jgi:hypothetical protein
MLRSLTLGLLLAAALPLRLFAQPANDDCSGAIELIPGVTCVPIAGTVAGATQSIPGTVTCDGFAATPDDDVWYRFTATATAHAIRVQGNGTFDAVIQLLSGTCNGTPIVCRDVVSGGGLEVLDIGGLSIGQEYLIRVFDWFATPPATPTFTICVGPSAIPANDDCAGAVTLVPDPACNPVAGTVALATASLPGTVLCDGFAADPNDDVWYRFVATASDHTITVAPGASFDAVVQLLAGPCNGAPIVCRDLVSAGQPEVINATGLTVGQEYFLRVFHWFTSATTTPGFTICVQGPAPICSADAGTITADAPTACLIDGAAFIGASGDGNSTVPAGYSVIYVLTEGPGLVIIATNPSPTFEVSAAGDYTIHTLVFDPSTLDLGSIVFGLTTGFDVNALLVQGGGSICGSLDVAGATITVEECATCDADAGTLTADASAVCLDNGAADISATPDGNAVVPTGYNALYVLTRGASLTIEAAGVAPNFSVTAAGDYTIHTLVYDPATLDLGVIEFGVTTGFDVLDLIAQSGICASLDAAGAPITVEECATCDADAGTLTADANPVCLDNGAADISATPDGNAVVPTGYNALYVLTRGASLTIEAAGVAPNFSVTAAGDYTIHTLVYDPATLDLGVIEFGVTTGFDVLDLIAQSGICASLDAAGAPITVEDCNACTAFAGTLTADDATVCLDGGMAMLSASPNGDAVVPDGFETVYVLTEGAGLVIIGANTSPDFAVTALGDYTIHTLVYDPTTLDLGIVEFGVTTGFDVNGLLLQGGGAICASLDVAGAAFTVELCIPCDASAGTLAIDESPVCLFQGSVQVGASVLNAPVVPDGYEVAYALTQGPGLIIVGLGGGPVFTISDPGTYAIHTLVFDPATIDPSLVELGFTSAFEIHALLVQGGGSICGALDLVGAPVVVNDCSPANDDCISAIPLSIYLDGACPANAVAGNNFYATFSGGDADCDDPGSYLQDVWYTFNAGANTSVTITLDEGTMEDWAFTVMDACGGGEIACEIQPGGGISVDVDPFTDYLVRVYSNFTFGNGGQFTICLTGAVESLVCDGATVQASSGQTVLDICQDAEADVIDFVTTSVSAEDYTFILTDEDDAIIAVLVGGSLDFNSAALGTYRVWGASHNGVLTNADPGAPVSGVGSTSGCFGLSSNFVQVNVEICSGVGASGAHAWAVFPNPSNGDFTLVAARDGAAELELLDLGGRVALRERVTLNSGERHALHLAGSLARGVYSLRITDASGTTALRVVVQ